MPRVAMDPRGWGSRYREGDHRRGGAWEGLAAAAWRVTALVVGLAVTGCGGTLYAVSSANASARLAEAKALHAERLAPYEYHYAEEHLRAAMEEAALADYGDAIDFADTAAEYASKAIKLAKRAQQEGSR
jgi:hypothetical protein